MTQGLFKCANTKIGTSLIRGVSGGERKRCSIGLELVVDPAVICTHTTPYIAHETVSHNPGLPELCRHSIIITRRPLASCGRQDGAECVVVFRTMCVLLFVLDDSPG